MKRLITLFAVLIASLQLCAEEFEGTVVKVGDGDTIWVVKPGHEVESDVTDFDAPDTPGQVKTSCQFAQLPPTFYKKWGNGNGELRCELVLRTSHGLRPWARPYITGGWAVRCYEP